MDKAYIVGVLFSSLFIVFTVLLQLHHPLATLLQDRDDGYFGPGLTCSEALANFSDWGNEEFAVESALIKNMSAGDCEVPPTGFKSWEEGVVTTLSPKVQKRCSKLFKGDKFSAIQVKSQLKHWKNSVGDEEVLEKTKKCSFGSFLFPVSFQIEGKIICCFVFLEMRFT